MKKKILSLMPMLSMLTTFALMSTVKAVSIDIGDYVQMGTYYGEPILWRCVDKDENGSLMLADKIICLKPYDAETSANNTTGSHSRRGNGTYSYESNYWGDSNMRSWLNSNESAGNVEWLCGNPPIESEVYYNAYDQEAGFMTNFMSSELSAVKEVTQKSILSQYDKELDVTGASRCHYYESYIADVVRNYDSCYAENITDKFFLLDVKQVNAVYNNSDVLGDYYYIGEPTEQCVANSEYTSSSLAVEKKWDYWLRSPCAYYGDNSTVRLAYSDGNIHSNNAYYGNNGVRPAFYLADNAAFSSGGGTESSPYTVEGTGETITPPQNDEITVTVNGSTVSFNQPPIILNDHTMVPLHAIFEALGAEVEWDGEDQTITAVRGNCQIDMLIGGYNIVKLTNGTDMETITLDTAPIILNDRTLVPVRAVAESFDCTVDWNGATRTVTILE